MENFYLWIWAEQILGIFFSLKIAIAKGNYIFKKIIYFCENFRVIVMELTPDQEFLMDNSIYAVPHDIMTGNNN